MTDLIKYRASCRSSETVEFLVCRTDHSSGRDDQLDELVFFVGW